MKRVTVSQAKSRLSAYIKSAKAGEEVVIMRGSKPAVLLHPISEKDLHLTPEISAAALAKFETVITHDWKTNARIELGDTPAEAAANLKRGMQK